MSPMCKVIDCSDSTYKYLNEELNICQTELQHIVSLLGGENGVFAIIISLILFLISIFIYIIKKARKNRPSAIN
jgi:hypothetical protein